MASDTVQLSLFHIYPVSKQVRSYRKKKDRVPVLCEYSGCGVGFYPRDGARFCSRECVQKERTRVSEELRKRVCERCGVQYVRHQPGGKGSRGESNEGRFCSNKCRGEWRADQYSLRRSRIRIVQLLSLPACEVCGQRCRRSGMRACSEPCREEWNSREARRKSEEEHIKKTLARECACCGVMFTPNYGLKKRKFCSDECAKKVTRGVRKHRHRARLYGVEYQYINPIFIFKRDSYRCQICGCRTLPKLRGLYDDRSPELDHRIPMSKGGSHTFENVQCACRKCNMAKSNRTNAGQIDLFPREGFIRHIKKAS